MGISASNVHYPRDSRDGFEALRILQKKLPAELALQILDYAQYWVISQVSRAQTISYQEHDCRDRAPYLVSDPIQGGRSPVREIQIEIWSHDQGWSSFTEDHGTYRNSWTWFEMGIIKAPGRESALEDLDLRLATNMHASGVTQNHHKVYRSEDDLPWMRSLQAGDRISIIPRALYPGWQNFVEKASIEIYTDPLT